METPNFNDIYTDFEAEMLKDAFDAITQCNLWEWLKTFQPHPNEGFMFSYHPCLTMIGSAMKYSGHSGSSHAWTMRIMEDIAKRGWEKHRESTISRSKGACPCRQKKGYSVGWCGVAGGGVPACEH